MWQILPPLRFSWRCQAETSTTCFSDTSCIYGCIEIQSLVTSEREGNPQKPLTSYRQKQQYRCCVCLLTKGQSGTPSPVMLGNWGAGGVSGERSLVQEKEPTYELRCWVQQETIQPSMLSEDSTSTDSKHKPNLHCDVQIFCSPYMSLLFKGCLFFFF